MQTHAHSTKEWKREQTKKIRRKSIERNRFSNNLGVKIGVFAITLKWIFLHLNTCYWLEQTFEIIHTETCTGLIISMRNAFFEIVNVCYVFFFIVNHTILYFFFVLFDFAHAKHPQAYTNITNRLNKPESLKTMNNRNSHIANEGSIFKNILTICNRFLCFCMLCDTCELLYATCL